MPCVADRRRPEVSSVSPNHESVSSSFPYRQIRVEFAELADPPQILRVRPARNASCVKSMAWMRATAQPCRHRGAKRVNEAWISPGRSGFCRQTERQFAATQVKSCAQISVVRRILVVRRVEKGSIVIVRTASHTHHLQALVDEEVR